FNPVTTINYDLPEPGRVYIIIYNILGKQVRTLVNGHQDAGYRSIQWNGTSDNGRRAAAGMYIYLIQAGDFIQSHKMTLLK
ncbi:MAG TPA: T9SS type A sorting domain-containing protein, partial [Candidatus Marinimicrobia bacterium]|nr:T9SS type A sorting domain-containing protein [Candidatus Neomarinimicrobiota bacterium]